MKTDLRFLFAVLASLALVGCGDDDGGGGDAGPGDDSGPGDTPTCEAYCTTVMASCTGGNAQYPDMGACMMYCTTNAGWDPGTAADTTQNTIGCRLYHAGVAGMMDPETHCPHAGPSGGDQCGRWCENYCQLALDNCTGDEQLFADMLACNTTCKGLDTTGEPGATGGDTVQCRIYHLGVAGTDASSAATHCPHGGEDGGGPGGPCAPVGGTFDFRTEAAAMYTRVDRMGMPAVSTALIAVDLRNGYNDSTPAADAMNMWADEIVAGLEGLHMALRDDLVMAGLTPCSTPPIGMMPPDVTLCVTQAGPAVIPDTVRLDTSMPAGFPNGRLFADPVIDMTLSLILLQQGVHDLNTLVGTNPTMNEQPLPDRMNTAAFPWLNPPYEM